MQDAGGAGLAMGVSWKRRYVQLGQMQRSLRMLHGEIRYTGAELPEAIDQIALSSGKALLRFLSRPIRANAPNGWAIIENFMADGN